MKSILILIFLTKMIPICFAQIGISISPERTYNVIPHPNSFIQLKLQAENIFVPKLISLHELSEKERYSIEIIKQAVDDNGRNLNYFEGIINSWPKEDLTDNSLVQAARDFHDLLVYIDTTLSLTDKIFSQTNPSLSKINDLNKLHDFFKIWSEMSYSYGYMASNLSGDALIYSPRKGTYIFELEDLKKYRFPSLKKPPSDLLNAYRSNAATLIRDNVYVSKVDSNYVINSKSLFQIIQKKSIEMGNWRNQNWQSFTDFNKNASNLLNHKRDSCSLKLDSVRTVRVELKIEKNRVDSLLLVIDKKENELILKKQPLTATITTIKLNRQELRRIITELDSEFEKYFKTYDEYATINVNDITKLLSKQRELLVTNRDIFKKRIIYDKLRNETDSLETEKIRLQEDVSQFENEIMDLKGNYVIKKSKYDLDYKSSERIFNETYDYLSRQRK